LQRLTGQPLVGSRLIRVPMDDIARVIVWIAAGAAAVVAAVFGFWRVSSMLKIWRAGAPRLRSSRAVIWRDPGAVEALDLAGGPGGAEGRPQPPFRFVEEHRGGSQPCVSVRDGRGRTWRVKWGDEVQVETLATRLAWAAGYFVETCYYVAEGTIDGAASLSRAQGCIADDGRFSAARFELDEDNVIKHFDEHSWAWTDNPFVGSPELHGLKIVMMWLSNWDAKDVRDVARGSNTAIFEYPLARGSSRRRQREARYLVIDWGGALGRWGSIVRRGRWDCEGLAAESPLLVAGVDGEFVRFGYAGQRTTDIADGIRVSDVRWLMQTLGRLTDRQIADAVAAAGGTPDEVGCFTRALRQRLTRLDEVAQSSQSAPTASQPFAVVRASNEGR
jgi:hypothetical protein